MQNQEKETLKGNGRELKFRAWDKQGKEMFNVVTLHMGSNNKLIAGANGGNAVIDEDTPLMQYTGLKDKNGVEIYEGDIVKGDWSIVDGIEVGEVEFYWGAFRFKPAGLPLAYGYSLKESEVIGNIYQNPESLKE